MTDPRITKEMIEAAAREYHERGNGEGSFDRIAEHVRSSLLFRMGCALEAVFALLPEPEGVTVLDLVRSRGDEYVREQIAKRRTPDTNEA